MTIRNVFDFFFRQQLATTQSLFLKWILSSYRWLLRYSLLEFYFFSAVFEYKWHVDKKRIIKNLLNGISLPYFFSTSFFIVYTKSGFFQKDPLTHVEAARRLHMKVVQQINKEKKIFLLYIFFVRLSWERDHFYLNIFRIFFTHQTHIFVRRFTFLTKPSAFYHNFCDLRFSSSSTHSHVVFIFCQLKSRFMFWFCFITRRDLKETSSR